MKEYSAPDVSLTSNNIITKNITVTGRISDNK